MDNFISIKAPPRARRRRGGRPLGHHAERYPLLVRLIVALMNVAAYEVDPANESPLVMGICFYRYLVFP